MKYKGNIWSFRMLLTSINFWWRKNTRLCIKFKISTRPVKHYIGSSFVLLKLSLSGILTLLKKSSKIPMEQSESVYRRRTQRENSIYSRPTRLLWIWMHAVWISKQSSYISKTNGNHSTRSFPSFFRHRTIFDVQGECDCLMIPLANSWWMWSLTSSYIVGGICLCFINQNRIHITT
jgi:hypothetical protein